MRIKEEVLTTFVEHNEIIPKMMYIRKRKDKKEMKLEKLKESHLKRNLLISIVIIGILITIVLTFTKARYRIAESIPLVNGTINYDLADLNAVAVYIQEGDDYSKSDTIPSSGYTFNEEKSYCTVNGEEDSNITVSYDANTQSLSVSPLTTQGTKCYLYFDEQLILLKDEILTSNEVNSGTPDFSQTATTDEGVYATTDNLGTSYYFRGAVINNYVQFAGYYWRIIRINGDGSIRIIYDGTSAHANGESSDDRQTGTSAFNRASGVYNTSVGVGYTYQTGSQRPNTQNSGTASTIKGILDNWYQTNIANKGYDDKVVSTPGFCNDRNSYSNTSGTTSSWVASGSTIYYAPYIRVYTTRQPSLQCSNNNDLYTTKVGLITADEVMLAGGVRTTANQSYYLYTGQYYWTMSPYIFFDVLSYARVFHVYSNGSLGYSNVGGTGGVRPVLNLSADVTISGGNGTSETPYVVS